jgi:hypothetical protein
MSRVFLPAILTGEHFRSDEWVCTRCRRSGVPRAVADGSTVVEVCLWLLFVLPGMAYSLWRLGRQRRLCRNCGSEALVPVDCRCGKALMAKEAVER